MTDQDLTKKVLKDILDTVLSEIDTDPDDGPRLRAAAAPLRIEFPDLKLVVNVSRDEGGRHCLRWNFSQRERVHPKLRLSMESWGDGTIGRDALGAPITLKGATFFRSLIQIQLDRFSIYWDRENLTATKLTYVPGFSIPAYGSNFGVRWDFLN